MRRIPAAIAVSCLALAACAGETAATTTAATTTTTVVMTTTTTSTSSTTTTTTQPPTTTTTTESPFDIGPSEPVVVDPQYLMTLDGFSAFGVLGDSYDDVAGAFQEAFGDPTADSDWLAGHGCSYDGSMRTVIWIEPGVRLVFVDGDSDFGAGQHLAAYSTVLPIDPPWEMEGIRREMTIDDVLVLFPDAETLPGPALDFIQFVPDVPSYAWIDASGQIREFWAGAEYCGD